MFTGIITSLYNWATGVSSRTNAFAIVYLKERRMDLWKQGAIIRQFHIAITDAPIGSTKELALIPTGCYKTKRATEYYNDGISLDYPNGVDAVLGRMNGILCIKYSPVSSPIGQISIPSNPDYEAFRILATDYMGNVPITEGGMPVMIMPQDLSASPGAWTMDAIQKYGMPDYMFSIYMEIMRTKKYPKVSITSGKYYNA